MDLGGGNLTRYFNCGVGDSGSPQTTFLPQPGNFYYGMTVSGGQYVRGDIYRFDVSSLQYTSLFSMDTASGYYPRGPLYKAGDGNLYGLTSNGGANGLGVLFRFDPSTNVYTKLHEFDGPTGQYPDGGVVQAANGKIYGMTTTGGSAGGGGVIFSWDPATSTYLVEYSFSFSDGFTPFGTLTEYNGFLWGLTFGGGATGNGTLFRFDPSTSTHLLKYSFDGTNGSAPQGNLTLGANGILYSAASQGGTDSYGVLFSFDTNNDQYTVLHDFDPLEGSRPRGQLCYASDGRCTAPVSTEARTVWLHLFLRPCHKYLCYHRRRRFHRWRNAVCRVDRVCIHHRHRRNRPERGPVFPNPRAGRSTMLLKLEPCPTRYWCTIPSGVFVQPCCL